MNLFSHLTESSQWNKLLLPRLCCACAVAVSVNDALLRVRSSLKRRGPQALVDLGKCFREMAVSDGSTLSDTELSRLLDSFDVSLSEPVRSRLSY